MLLHSSRHRILWIDPQHHSNCKQAKHSISIYLTVAHLSPHDALKHHFTSLKTDLIFLQAWVLERKFPWNWFTNIWKFSLIFKPHQIIFIHYKNCVSNSRLVVDKDDNGKFRLERVNPYSAGMDFSRQNLTSKVDSHTARVNMFLIAL